MSFPYNSTPDEILTFTDIGSGTDTSILSYIQEYKAAVDSGDYNTINALKEYVDPYLITASKLNTIQERLRNTQAYCLSLKSQGYLNDSGATIDLKTLGQLKGSIYREKVTEQDSILYTQDKVAIDDSGTYKTVIQNGLCYVQNDDLTYMYAKRPFKDLQSNGYAVATGLSLSGQTLSVVNNADSSVTLTPESVGLTILTSVDSSTTGDTLLLTKDAIVNALEKKANLSSLNNYLPLTLSDSETSKTISYPLTFGSSLNINGDLTIGASSTNTATLNGSTIVNGNITFNNESIFNNTITSTADSIFNNIEITGATRVAGSSDYPFQINNENDKIWNNNGTLKIESYKSLLLTTNTSNVDSTSAYSKEFGLLFRLASNNTVPAILPVTGDSSLLNQRINLGASSARFNTIYCQTLSKSSDSRLKNTIGNISDKYELMFDMLEPVTYKFNNDNEKMHIGFIAQDVETAAERANIDSNQLSMIEKPTDDSEYYSLVYDEFIALNTHMIKKLEQRILDLEKELAQIKGGM